MGIGPLGVYLICGFWAGHRIWGGTALEGYSCLYLLVLRPPVCLVSFKRKMSLFLSWLVGSLGRTL